MRDSSVSVVERCAFPMLAPSASTSAALIESEIGVSSGPLAADTVRLGASACSASETVLEPVVEARLPPSLARGENHRPDLQSHVSPDSRPRPSNKQSTPLHHTRPL